MIEFEHLKYFLQLFCIVHLQQQGFHIRQSLAVCRQMDQNLSFWSEPQYLPFSWPSGIVFQLLLVHLIRGTSPLKRDTIDINWDFNCRTKIRNIAHGILGHFRTRKNKQ